MVLPGQSHRFDCRVLQIMRKHKWENWKNNALRWGDFSSDCCLLDTNWSMQLYWTAPRCENVCLCKCEARHCWKRPPFLNKDGNTKVNTTLIVICSPVSHSWKRKKRVLAWKQMDASESFLETSSSLLHSPSSPPRLHPSILKEPSRDVCTLSPPVSK